MTESIAKARAAIDEVIRARKTEKFLVDVNAPLAAEHAIHEVVAELLELASWAPFHKPADAVHLAGNLTSVVPWRFYTLDAMSCRVLLETLKTWAKDDPKWLNGKMPSLLASADAMIQATWLPNPAKRPISGLFEATKDNMEHIAAASAAVQNLLLAATARGLPNYWASGGQLLEPEVHSLLGIPASEIVLGSLFLFPKQAHGAQIVTGAWRDKRGLVTDWSRPVILR